MFSIVVKTQNARGSPIKRKYNISTEYANKYIV